MDEFTDPETGIRTRACTFYPGYVRLDDEQLPLLALVLQGREPDTVQFADGRQWLPAVHQTAGVACHQQKLLLTPLTPRPGVVEALRQLAERYDASNLGCGPTRLTELVEYQTALTELLGPSASCDLTHPLLEEGVYPLDATAEALAALCEDELPERLDELVCWRSDLDRIAGSMGRRWALVVLSANSD